MYTCTRRAVTEKLCRPCMHARPELSPGSLSSMYAARAHLSLWKLAIHVCCACTSVTVEACHPCMLRVHSCHREQTQTQKQKQKQGWAHACRTLMQQPTRIHKATIAEALSHERPCAFFVGWKPLMGLFLLWYTSPHKNTHLARDRDRRDLWYRGPKFRRSFPEGANRPK